MFLNATNLNMTNIHHFLNLFSFGGLVTKSKTKVKFYDYQQKAKLFQSDIST